MDTRRRGLPEALPAVPPVGWNGTLRVGRREIPVSYDAASRWAVRLWRVAVLVGIVAFGITTCNRLDTLTGTIATKEASCPK